MSGCRLVLEVGSVMSERSEVGGRPKPRYVLRTGSTAGRRKEEIKAQASNHGQLESAVETGWG